MEMTRKKFCSVVGGTWLALLASSPNLRAEESPGASVAQRKPVIPKEVIEAFQMEPAQTRMFTVRGEDGNWYGIDDTLRVLFEMTKKHWYDDQQERLKMQMQQMAPAKKK